MVNLEQIQLGINNYVDQEIIAKATASHLKFIYGFCKGAFMGKIPKLINKYKDNPMIQALEIFDENGNVDIDNVYKWAKESIQKSGQIIYGGLIFTESDVDKLYNFIVSTIV